MLIATGVMTCASMAPAMAAPETDEANQGWNLTVNKTITTDVTNVQPGSYVDFSSDDKNITISKESQGFLNSVKVNLNKDIDVSSVQTNALNSKYNLSVGTANENGTMPFFVNSNGAFYAANGKLVVDKDGNVTAGNVVLNNGVFYKNSALRDGELFVGDASGNYSQITPKSAKLGQVTIDEKGNIAGVNSIQTNALNAKYNLSVGTANENGTVPFFVNSNGAFYAANGKLVVDKDGKLVAPEAELGKVTADEGVIGNVVLKDGVFYKHTALRDGELFVGDADGNYSQITTKGAKLGQVVIAEDGKISNVTAGVADTDAVNVGQLKEAVEAGNTDTHIKPGEYGVGADNTVNMDVVDKNGNKVDTVTIKDVAKASDVGNISDLKEGVLNKDGSKTTVVDAINNIDTRVGNVETKVEEIGAIAKAHNEVSNTDKNITVDSSKKTEAGGTIFDVNLNKDKLDLNNVVIEGNKGKVTAIDVEATNVNATTVTTGQTVMNNDGLKVGKDVSVTATAVTAGQTSINNDGLKVNGKTYVSDKGLNANDQKVTNVAAGELSANSKDAVNGGQLFDTNRRLDNLGNRVNKVGAGAAALAALHPMDFDPDDKLTFSAGYGNYGGENAAAIGAYYRPDEKVMFSVAGTVGNGENMVNAGVSFALDRTNHVSNSRTALAREVIDLRGQLAVMGAKMAKMEKAFGMLDETKTKLFPDVPANHWAYEYIAKLAGNGYIEGYPDGNFGGDRLMTRYEFAAMLYRAIENGAALEEKIIKEFEPELGRIRVDRISGEDGDRDKIERVRVNDTKGERDHYGNKLAK